MIRNTSHSQYNYPDGSLQRPVPRRNASIVWLITLSAFLTLPLYANSIRLHDQAGSNDEKIQLSEIAELEGTHAESYGDVVIATFNQDAKSMTLDLAQVRIALTKADANWAQLALKGYATCEVFHTPDGKEQPNAIIGDDRAIALNAEIDLASDAHGTVKSLLVARITELANADRSELKIEFRDRPTEKKWLDRSALVGRYELQPLSRSGLGRVPIKVRRFDESGAFEQITISAEVSRRLTTLVATQSIRRGETFSEANTEVKEIYITSDQGPVLDDTSLVIGQSSSAMLREGAVVMPSHIAKEVLVERGDLVTVTCISGSLLIRTVSRANSAGSAGDVISLRNEQTRETYQATITARRQATIIQPVTTLADAK